MSEEKLRIFRVCLEVLEGSVAVPLGCPSMFSITGTLWSVFGDLYAVDALQALMYGHCVDEPDWLHPPAVTPGYLLARSMFAWPEPLNRVPARLRPVVRMIELRHMARYATPRRDP